MKNTLIIMLFSLFISTAWSQSGSVPSDYGYIRNFLAGSFQGAFGGNLGMLEIHFDGDRPSISFRDSQGNSDILGGNCQSQIGELIDFETFTLAKSATRRFRLTFAFDSGNCPGVGREMTIFFLRYPRTNSVSISALDVKIPLEARGNLKGKFRKL